MASESPVVASARLLRWRPPIAVRVQAKLPIAVPIPAKVPVAVHLPPSMASNRQPQLSSHSDSESASSSPGSTSMFTALRVRGRSFFANIIDSGDVDSFDSWKPVTTGVGDCEPGLLMFDFGGNSSRAIQIRLNSRMNAVEGAGVVLFYNQNLAVHGLGGDLWFCSQILLYVGVSLTELRDKPASVPPEPPPPLNSGISVSASYLDHTRWFSIDQILENCLLVSISTPAPSLLHQLLWLTLENSEYAQFLQILLRFEINFGAYDVIGRPLSSTLPAPVFEFRNASSNIKDNRSFGKIVDAAGVYMGVHLIPTGLQFFVGQIGSVELGVHVLRVDQQELETVIPQIGVSCYYYSVLQLYVLEVWNDVGHGSGSEYPILFHTRELSLTLPVFHAFSDWGPGWNGSSIAGLELPLSKILPDPCVESSCSDCGIYPQSDILCSGNGNICRVCSPLPNSSPPSKALRRGLLSFEIVGEVGALSGICPLTYCFWAGICFGNKKIHNSVQPIIIQIQHGIWIKLPVEVVNFVEPAVNEGFYFHHAEPKYLMLVYWILETSSTLPANASPRIGIAALVMNDKRKVLVVQENNGRFRGSEVWKFPPGVVDEGEDICDSAVREVKAETKVIYKQNPSPDKWLQFKLEDRAKVRHNSHLFRFSFDPSEKFGLLHLPFLIRVHYM